METTIDFEKIVQELNQDIFEKHGEIEFRFSYSTDGFLDLILFDEYIIWSSEDDNRKFNEYENEYEPFKPFIKKVFNKYIDEIYLLKFRA